MSKYFLYTIIFKEGIHIYYTINIGLFLEKKIKIMIERLTNQVCAQSA